MHIRPAKYTAILLLRDDKSAATLRTISVTVPGPELATTDELQTRAVRICPFSSTWKTDVSVPLSAPMVPQIAGLRDDAAVGVLKRDSLPGYALVNWALPGSKDTVTQLDMNISGIGAPGDLQRHDRLSWRKVRHRLGTGY